MPPLTSTFRVALRCLHPRAYFCHCTALGPQKWELAGFFLCGTLPDWCVTNPHAQLKDRRASSSQQSATYGFGEGWQPQPGWACAHALKQTCLMLSLKNHTLLALRGKATPAHPSHSPQQLSPSSRASGCMVTLSAVFLLFVK